MSSINIDIWVGEIISKPYISLCGRLALYLHAIGGKKFIFIFIFFHMMEGNKINNIEEKKVNIQERNIYI